MLKRNSPPDTNISPYLSARREWNERYGSYIAQARSWRITAILSLITAAIAVSGLVALGTQGQIVPYVVKVDKLGAVAAVDRADLLEKPDRPVITAALSRFIADMRSIYVDAAAERAILKEGYAMINRRADAYIAMNEYMRAHDPFERAKTETVTVEVESVLPLSNDTWRVEWREEKRSRDGSQPSATQMQATINIGFSPPTDEATIRVNPIGLYVLSFDWAQRL